MDRVAASCCRSCVKRTTRLWSEVMPAFDAAWSASEASSRDRSASLARWSRSKPVDGRSDRNCGRDDQVPSRRIWPAAEREPAPGASSEHGTAAAAAGGPGSRRPTKTTAAAVPRSRTTKPKVKVSQAPSSATSGRRALTHLRDSQSKRMTWSATRDCVRVLR